MLSKKNRLGRREIEELKASKTGVLQGKFFGLIFQEQKGKKAFALIISNKIAPGAVRRNEIKRLFFKAVEENFPDKEGKFLFLAKKSCLISNLEEFKKEMVAFGNNIID